MKVNSKNLVTAGLVSYLLIGLNIISGIILGPLILRKVGDDIYGVYSTVMSIVNILSIVNVGISQALARYIAVYNASETSKEDIAKLCKTIKYINQGIALLIIIISIIIFFLLPRIYLDVFSYDEIVMSRKVFLILASSLVFTIFSEYYAGIISGYGYFVFLNLVNVCRVALRLCLTIILIIATSNIYLVAAVNAISALIILIAEILFVKKNILLPNSRGYVEKSVLIEINIYAFLVFVQSVFDQISSNVDNVMISTMIGAAEVAVYSFALSLFHAFSNLSTAISNMLVPMMAKLIENKASNYELENMLIKIGKIQFMINGAALFGFLSVGRLFIKIWLGNGYSDVYEIVLVLMAGGVFHYIQNGAFSVLRVKNLMGFGTGMLMITALMNVGITYFLVSNFGYKYAMIGTSFALVSYTIIMDIYYHKKLGLNMLRVLWNTVKLIAPSNISAAICACLVIRKVNNDYAAMITAIIIYIFVYMVLLYFIVLGIDEKKKIKEFFRNVRK